MNTCKTFCQEPKKSLLIYLAPECLNNELEAGRLHSFNALLNDVVSVLVFDAFDDVAFQFGNDEFLLVQGNTFQGLLNDATPVHLQGERLDFGAKLKHRRK